MSRTVNVDDIVDEIQRKADMENTAFASDAKVIAALNFAWRDLYADLVSQYQRFFVTTDTVTLVSGTSEYSLPSDFWLMEGISLVDDTRTFTLRPWPFNHRNYLNGRTDRPRYYVLYGQTVRYIATPDAAYTGTMHYVPVAPTLAAAGTFVDPNGYSNYLLYAVAADFKAREESDTTFLERRAAEARRRIVDTFNNMNAGQPDHMTDVEAMRTMDPWVDWGRGY